MYDTLFEQTPEHEISVSVADTGNPSEEKIAALTLRSFVVRLLSKVSRLVIEKLPAAPAVATVRPLPEANVRADPTSACTVTLIAALPM